MIQIGNVQIDDIPSGDEYDTWVEEQLIPAGEQFMVDADEHMGFQGRPATNMEMEAVRMAAAYSMASIAARWMADFESFIEGGDDVDSDS